VIQDVPLVQQMGIIHVHLVLLVIIYGQVQVRLLYAITIAPPETIHFQEILFFQGTQVNISPYPLTLSVIFVIVYVHFVWEMLTLVICALKDPI
jgi:hypothetical protein